mmetsp:Transcript_5609/g.16543  ORF Transcript_5609/g.16543 Transcript_5609/m.16543 type:complete len:249 (-) Transcript_5609:1375-2121(-)
MVAQRSVAARAARGGGRRRRALRRRALRALRLRTRACGRLLLRPRARAGTPRCPTSRLLARHRRPPGRPVTRAVGFLLNSFCRRPRPRSSSCRRSWLASTSTFSPTYPPSNFSRHRALERTLQQPHLARISPRGASKLVHVKLKCMLIFFALPRAPRQPVGQPRDEQRPELQLQAHFGPEEELRGDVGGREVAHVAAQARVVPGRAQRSGISRDARRGGSIPRRAPRRQHASWGRRAAARSGPGGAFG